MAQKLADAERRMRALAEQRDVLQQQLEKAAGEAQGEGEHPTCIPRQLECSSGGWLARGALLAGA